MEIEEKNISQDGLIYHVTNGYLNSVKIEKPRKEYEINIPEGIKGISPCVFECWSDIIILGFPAELTLEGMDQFATYDCGKLTSITLPEGLASIGAYAFNECTFLKEVTLPSTLEYVGNAAFDDCSEEMTIHVSRKWYYTYPALVANLPLNAKILDENGEILRERSHRLK